MRSTALAEKYAKALFESAKELGKEEQVVANLKELKKAFSDSEELQSFASSPVIKAADKMAVMKSVVSSLKLEGIYANLLILLAANDRLSLIGEILDSYQVQVDDANGITRGTAQSAKEMTDAEKQEVASVISKLLSKKVILDYKVDANLIGSLVAQVGSLTIDDSLKTHLNRLEDDLNRRVH